MSKTKTTIIILILGLIVLIPFCMFIFWAYTSWSMPYGYSYGEYIFSSSANEFPIPKERLFYKINDGYGDRIHVIAIKEIDDIEGFICGGGYNWDQIPPDKCNVESRTENSITIYTLSNKIGDDSVAEKEVKFTFSRSEEGFFLSKREVRQRCVPGRGWSLSLYPGNCS